MGNVIKCTKDKPFMPHLHAGDSQHDDAAVILRDEDFPDGEAWAKYACPHCGTRWWTMETSAYLAEYLHIDRLWRREEDETRQDAMEDAMLSLWERMSEGEKTKARWVCSLRSRQEQRRERP